MDQNSHDFLLSVTDDKIKNISYVKSVCLIGKAKNCWQDKIEDKNF